MPTYIVEISQYGQVVKTETVGSSEMARQIAEEWRSKGYSVRVTDSHNASYPF